MAFNYSQRLSFIYNELAKQGLAKQNAGGMWYETHGVAIYAKGSSYEGKKEAREEERDEYLIRAESHEEESREEITATLENLFGDSDFVEVGEATLPQTLGPR